MAGGLLSQGCPSALHLVESVADAIGYFISDRPYKIADPVGIAEFGSCWQVEAVGDVLALREGHLDRKFVKLSKH